MTDVLKWLEEARALRGDLLLDYGVKATGEAGQDPAVAFPYRRGGGDVYAWKFRTVGKRFWSTKGVSRGLWNEQELHGGAHLPVVITEGEIDALSCIQAGFHRAVSVPNGWAADRTSDDALVEAVALLKASPFVIVAGDADAAGAGMPRYVANLLKGHDVRHAVWPEGCKDANDVLQRFGEGELARCLNAARRMDPPGGLITGFSDLPPMNDRRVLRVGERPFDWAVALELGAMSVWTGIPGSGKSTFLTFASDRISLHERVRVGMIMFETHPHTIRDQLALAHMGSEFAMLAPEWKDKLQADLDARFRLVHYRPQDDIAQSMGWLENMVRALALRDGCKLILVDPWNELEHLLAPGETMTTYINWAIKTLRQWAEELDVHIALVAHPRKMPTDVKPRAPNGYDVADSAAFFNKPSLGVTVHLRQEPSDDGPPDEWVELHVWKVRNTRLYRVEKGKVDLSFDKASMTYRERARERAGVPA